jgi:hypothetical protein
MNKQVFNCIVTPDLFSNIKQASEVGDVQFHRLLTSDADPFSGQDEFHDRLTAAFNEIHDLDQEVRARTSDIFTKYGLGNHGFYAILCLYYDRAKDNYITPSPAPRNLVNTTGG